MPRPDDFDISPIIEKLQGTCMITLDQAIEELHPDMDSMDMIKSDHSQLDNEIFLCETCGWWCEISEQVGEEGNCSDCEEENED